MSEEKGPLAQLKIPTNPNYSWEYSAELQAEFVNPVVLSNKMVHAANTALSLTDLLFSKLKRATGYKLSIAKCRNTLADMEEAVLLKSPPTKEAKKNLKALHWYIVENIRAEDQWEAHAGVRTELRAAEWELVGVEEKIAALRRAFVPI